MPIRRDVAGSGFAFLRIMILLPMQVLFDNPRFVAVVVDFVTIKVESRFYFVKLEGAGLARIGAPHRGTQIGTSDRRRTSWSGMGLLRCRAREGLGARVRGPI